MAGVTIDEQGVPRDAAGRVLRGCDTCAQVDDHPRHVLGVPPGWPGAVPDGAVIAALVRAADKAGATDEQLAHLIGEQADPLTVVRHLDCCRDNGCYDGTCGEQLAAAGDKRRGELVAALEKQTADMTRKG